MKKIIRIKQFSALLDAHAKEILREPGVLFWGILFPLLMTLGLGIAFTQSREAVRKIAVVENVPDQRDDSLNFRSFLREKTQKIKTLDKEHNKYKLAVKDEKLGSAVYFFEEATWNEAAILLKRGEANLIVEDKEDGIKYHFDPINPEGQITYLNISRIIKNKGSLEETQKEKVEPLTLQGTRYVDFLVPGLISMGIMMSSVWGLGYNIIEKRSRKLLRRMIATPMKKSHFLISLMTIRTIMNFIEGGLLFLFAYLVFGIIIQGSILALIFIFIAGNIAFAGVAVFTACRTANTEVGNGLINAVTTPMIVLSGIFFSYQNFPDWAVSFIRLLPLSLLADGIRAIFIEGAGFREITVPFLILIATGVVSFSIGLKIFKWH
jgi:ABC-type multidrug transport system permease subunit